MEIVTNEPFDDGTRKGQYTHKIYHLARYNGYKGLRSLCEDD